MDKVESYKKISIKFKQYIQEINMVWETFSTIDFYSEYLHDKIKDETIQPPQVQTLTYNKRSIKKISKNQSYGTLSHIKSTQNPRNALISANLIFEKYISDLVMMVYKDYPQKSLALNQGQENTEKITNIIFSSTDKEEIIDRMLEEKIRGIFYGNISDLFIKDKAKLELKDTFKTEVNIELINILSEIIARRNIHIHNAGKVDRKYVRETHSDLKLDKKLSMDSEYIRNTINVFSEVAKLTTIAVLTNIYKAEPNNSLLNRTYWKK